MGISRYDVRRVIANEDQGYQEDILERRDQENQSFLNSHIEVPNF